MPRKLKDGRNWKATPHVISNWLVHIWCYIRLRIAGDAEYHGRGLDERRVSKVPSELHVEEIVISRSAFIKDRRVMVQAYIKAVSLYFWSAGLLSKDVIELATQAKLLHGESKQKVEIITASATVHDLRCVLFLGILFASWYGGIACYRCIINKYLLIIRHYFGKKRNNVYLSDLIVVSDGNPFADAYRPNVIYHRRWNKNLLCDIDVEEGSGSDEDDADLHSNTDGACSMYKFAYFSQQMATPTVGCALKIFEHLESGEDEKACEVLGALRGASSYTVKNCAMLVVFTSKLFDSFFSNYCPSGSGCQQSCRVITGEWRYGTMHEAFCQGVQKMLRSMAKSELSALVKDGVLSADEITEMSSTLIPYESALCVFDKIQTFQRCGGGVRRRSMQKVKQCRFATAGA
mmetsp:Transcript_83297/g.131495  ORF Transcript_83297/g.131495 Transcript_83297/m.131495 type:complete len:405 (-) Transcript_83297:110-1324(-)